MKRTKRIKDKSTISKIEYIIDHILIGGIIGFKFVCTLLPFWGYGSYVDGTFRKMLKKIHCDHYVYNNDGRLSCYCAETEEVFYV